MHDDISQISRGNKLYRSSVTGIWLYGIGYFFLLPSELSGEVLQISAGNCLCLFMEYDNIFAAFFFLLLFIFFQHVAICSISLRPSSKLKPSSCTGRHLALVY